MIPSRAHSPRHALTPSCVHPAVAVGAFTLYTAVMGQKMSAWVVFPSLTLFSQLRFPVMFFPRVLSMSADALVSLARLQKFLQLPETASAARSQPPAPPVCVHGLSSSRHLTSATPLPTPSGAPDGPLPPPRHQPRRARLRRRAPQARLLPLQRHGGERGGAVPEARLGRRDQARRARRVRRLRGLGQVGARHGAPG